MEIIIIDYWKLHLMNAWSLIDFENPIIGSDSGNRFFSDLAAWGRGVLAVRGDQAWPLVIFDIYVYIRVIFNYLFA